METSKKRRSFTIKEKVDLIEESLQPGYSQAQAAKKHKIRQSTLSSILLNKDKILSLARQGPSSASRKSYRSRGKEHDLEEQLYDWFLKKRGQGLSVDRPLLRKQAEEMAKKLDLGTSMTFSHGWLMRWRARFGVQHKSQHGEAQSADAAAATTWIQESLPLLLTQYTPRDIFNSDETGLFYRGMTTKGLVPQGESAAGVKTRKERLTILVTANMDGSEKPKLLVIGKAAKPRGFPRDLSSLPVTWESSKAAWMTGRIWTKFLRTWDVKLRSQNRKILLLADNAPCHCHVDGLTNIKQVFLPKNTTSLIQPCDAGIIKNLKGLYRNELRNRILANLEAHENQTAENLVRAVSVIDAIHMISRAWKEGVKAATIANCFGKAFSFSKKGNKEDGEDFHGFNPLHDVPLPAGMSSEEFEALLEEEDEEAPEEDDQVAEESDEEEEEDDASKPVNAKECLIALDSVRRYAQGRGLNSMVLMGLQSIERDCVANLSEGKSQSRITDFFKK